MPARWPTPISSEFMSVAIYPVSGAVTRCVPSSHLTVDGVAEGDLEMPERFPEGSGNFGVPLIKSYCPIGVPMTVGEVVTKPRSGEVQLKECLVP